MYALLRSLFGGSSFIMNGIRLIARLEFYSRDETVLSKGASCKYIVYFGMGKNCTCTRMQVCLSRFRSEVGILELRVQEIKDGDGILKLIT